MVIISNLNNLLNILIMDTKSKTENKPMPALMRKTKTQLIDIILRKDSIECNLRNDIKTMENKLNDYEEKVNNYKEKLSKFNTLLISKDHDYNVLNDDFKSSCDENASTICDLKETIEHNKSTIFKLYISLVVSFLIILCLCCL
nr:MAG TPA: syntaxin 5 [Crassvirales sp.]